MGTTDAFSPLFPILGLALAIVIFLISRELLCWYWKINQVVALLTEICDRLKNN